MPIAGADTTWKHGTNGAPSTNTDFTTKTRDASPSFGSDEEDATVFGDSFREFEQTFKNAEITVQYKYDAAIFQVVADLYTNGTVVTWELGPAGITAGNPKMSGSMILRTFTAPFQVGRLMVFDVTYRVTGAVLFNTF